MWHFCIHVPSLPSVPACTIMYHLYHLWHTVWINNLIKNIEQKVTFSMFMYLGVAWLLLFCHWRLFWFAPTSNQFPISVCRTNWKLQRTILLLETPATKRKKQNSFKGFSSSWIFTRPKANLSPLSHLSPNKLFSNARVHPRLKTSFFFVTIWNCFLITNSTNHHPNNPN